MLEIPDVTDYPMDSPLNLSGEWDQTPSGLQGAGVFARTIGTGPGQVRWEQNGGFAAKGGPLTLTFNSGGSLGLGQRHRYVECRR